MPSRRPSSFDTRFVDGQALGVLEAKKRGVALVEVETQSAPYVDGMPDWIKVPAAA